MPVPNGSVETPAVERSLTHEQVQRGLYPQTLADLSWRTRVFEVLTAGEAAHRQKQAKKKGKK